MVKGKSELREADRFDQIKPGSRVGVHRTKPKLGSAKTTVLFAVLSTLLLTVVGIIFVQLQPGSLKFTDKETPTETIAPKPQVQGALDPDAEVIVLNGSEVADLAYFVDDQITENGWGQVIFSGDAETSDVILSAVFYGTPDKEAAAIALGEQLGGMKAYLDPARMNLGGDLAILLGSDYKGPGYDNALNGVHPRSAEALTLNQAAEEYVEDAYYTEEYYAEEYAEY